MRARTIYTLDQTEVKRHIDNNDIYQRGYDYCRSGKVLHLEVRDDQLRARVTGSYGNTYKIEIWCEEEELFSTCTCPYDRGTCKHVAAVLCAWLHRRADPQSYTQTTTAQLRAGLEAIPRPLLIDELMDEAKGDMLLERYVKRWLEKLSPNNLHKLVADLLRHTRAGSHAEITQTLERVVRILTWSESLPPEPAIKVATETLKQLQTRPDLLPHANTVAMGVQSLTILKTHISQTSLDQATGRTVLRLLVKLIEHQTSAWQNPLTETLLELSGRMGEREFLVDEVRRKAFGDEPSLMRLLAALYKTEGRMEEYAGARSKSLIDEADYVELFQHYVEENRPEEAMNLGEQGMKQLESGAPQLAEQLTALYLEWGERELARKHLLRCFQHWPSKKLLKQIEEISEGKKNWNTERTKLQKKLAAKAGTP